MDLSQVKVPAFLWAIGIIVVIALIHTNEAWIQANLGITPVILDAGVAILIGILKGMNLSTDQLDQALRIIAQLQAQRIRETPLPGQQMRSASSEPVILGPIPESPSKLTTWLVG